MIALVFDTETTGFVKFKEPSVSPSQPNLVQLGALLVDLSTGREYGSLDVIVYPANWKIPQEAALVHGVSQGIAEKVGVNLDTAVNLFVEWVEIADVVVCHNVAFDKVVMERAVAMVNLANNEEVIDPFAGKPMFCTMKAATPIVKKKGRRPLHDEDYKWPKLIECMEFFFNEGLDGAHNAIVDCRATVRVLIEMENRGLINIPVAA